MDKVSPSKEIQSERIKTLFNLINKNKRKILISSVNAISQKTVNVDFLKKNIIIIEYNKQINFDNLISQLLNLGYYRTSVVREKSEFAVRGSIIDIFLSDQKNPIRLDFFDNVIENIFEFDKLTQKKIKRINKKIIINPSNELILNDFSLNIFRKNFRKIFSNYRYSETYKLFSDLMIPPGGENFIPLFFNSMSNIFSFCKNFTIIINDEFKSLLELREENINDFYNARNNENDSFNLEPKYLYLQKKDIEEELKNFSLINFKKFKIQKNNFNLKKIPNLSSIRKEIDFDLIYKFFEINNKKKIVICSNSEGAAERIIDIFIKNLNIVLKKINTLDDICTNQNFFVTKLKLSESIEYKEFIFLNEISIFGYNLFTSSTKDRKKEIFFEEINKFTKNTILVHSEYGLCRFLNISKININKSEHECIELEFSENQKLLVPIENLNLLTRYGNIENSEIKLDRLGSAHWQKRKAEAKNKIKESAKKLMSIAAQRLNSKSYNINFDPIIYEKFCSTFQFVETDDQLKAIEDIKNDFSKPTPSDRLIVGDVAFGKTEIIIRAVFLAAKSNIQSLVLVPTTLLSRQHFTNFTKRLTPFKIKIVEISRLITNKEREKIYESLSNGSVDVLIGTHAVLNDKVKFKKLGLIIYDEEQKLGTLQKEKFKLTAPKAHVLSLSATPIPRTLSLSLSGIRDLSLITTAPYERLSVRTYISPFDEITITEAIKREIIGRKNSVFFVTPRTKDIPILEKFLKKRLPNIKYVTAHGKLNSRILEERITKFYNQEVPLMISTNIIENGLDLPHVNTIIIYRSNILSLATLYQLKGRVGRSTKRGYAYLTYNEKEMNENSRKRLNIINSFNEIGSGFNVASNDLNLRGGGSIIGEEQSGFIKEVGIELYHQMLEEEINHQKNKIFNKKSIKIQKYDYQPFIKIPEKIYIPDNYINDLDVKISIYKRISNITENSEKDNLILELIDRFGKLPIEVKNLFKLIEIKIICFQNNIDQIEFGKRGILFSFYKNSPNNPDKIFKLCLKDTNNFELRNDQKVFYNFLGNLNFDNFDLVKNITNKLS